MRLGEAAIFSTWATLQDSLGKGIAHWLKKNRPSGRSWHVIEIGGGSGQLARSVLRHLGWWNKPRYHVIDVSPILREQQRKLLRGQSVSWHEEIGEALAAANGEALIFSNELVDAFPCRIFRLAGEQWEELSLQIEGGRWREVWVAAALPETTIAEHLWPEGQRVETHESFRNWLASWLPRWRRGACSRSTTAIFAPRSTIAARTERSVPTRIISVSIGPDAYGGFGKRDLTTNVNFSDLELWGEQLGLRNERSKTLGEFLASQGVSESLGPDASSAFRVLIQLKP